MYWILAIFLLGFQRTTVAETKPLYENNFQNAQVGTVPADFLVLDGGFVVKEESGNRFLELPGSPLDSFAAQFGPAEADNATVAARIRSTSKGRRFPTFGVGLNGVAGYRLQVSPARKTLELYKDQALKSSMPYEWKSQQWTKLRLQVRKLKEGSWKVQAKAWPEEQPEPTSWLVAYDDSEAPPNGKASIFGSPFSGTPIQFDDLVVTRTQLPP
jgi:hypothetical protein